MLQLVMLVVLVVMAAVAVADAVASAAAMVAVIVGAAIPWALPGFRMVPGGSVYKAKGYDGLLIGRKLFGKST